MPSKIQQSNVINKRRTSGYVGWTPERAKGDEDTITSFKENEPSLHADLSVDAKSHNEMKENNSDDENALKNKSSVPKEETNKARKQGVRNRKDKLTNKKVKSKKDLSVGEFEYKGNKITHDFILDIFSKYPFEDIYPTIRGSSAETTPTTIMVDAFYIDDLVFDIIVKAKKVEKRKLTNKEIFTRGIIQSYKYFKDNTLIEEWSKQKYPLENTTIPKPAAALYNDSVKYMFVDLTLARWVTEHKQILERAILLIADHYGVKY